MTSSPPSSELKTALGHADWCARVLMPCVLELAGLRPHAERLRRLPRVTDATSAARALALLREAMQAFPQEDWARRGWWAMSHAAKTLERREDAYRNRRRAAGDARWFADSVAWHAALHQERQRGDLAVRVRSVLEAQFA